MRYYNTFFDVYLRNFVRNRDKFLPSTEKYLTKKEVIE